MERLSPKSPFPPGPSQHERESISLEGHLTALYIPDLVQRIWGCIRGSAVPKNRRVILEPMCRAILRHFGLERCAYDWDDSVYSDYNRRLQQILGIFIKMIYSLGFCGEHLREGLLDRPDEVEGAICWIVLDHIDELKRKRDKMLLQQFDVPGK